MQTLHCAAEICKTMRWSLSFSLIRMGTRSTDSPQCNNKHRSWLSQGNVAKMYRSQIHSGRRSTFQDRSCLQYLSYCRCAAMPCYMMLFFIGGCKRQTGCGDSLAQFGHLSPGNATNNAKPNKHCHITSTSNRLLCQPRHHTNS